MLQSSTYLLINFFTILICLIASFDKRIRFDKHFGTFLLSSTIVAVPIIAWDIWFTDMGVWWFNTDYTTGVILAGLPIEEWMFIYFIPFACVFTYFCFDKFFVLSWANSLINVLVFFITISCALVLLLYYDIIYSLIIDFLILLHI